MRQRWYSWQSTLLCSLTGFPFPLSLCHSCQLVSDYGDAFNLPFCISLSLVLHFVLSSMALNYCNFVLQSLINSCSVPFSRFHPIELKAMTPALANGVNAELKYPTTRKWLETHIMAPTFMQLFWEIRPVKERPVSSTCGREGEQNRFQYIFSRPGCGVSPASWAILCCLLLSRLWMSVLSSVSVVRRNRL